MDSKEELFILSPSDRLFDINNVTESKISFDDPFLKYSNITEGEFVWPP